MTKISIVIPSDEDVHLYDVSAEINIDPDATSTEYAEAVFEAMKIEGYHRDSIKKSFMEIAQTIEEGDLY